MSILFKLQDFEGPLDLLLYLIDKHKMSIYDIEISCITDQYMLYLEDTHSVELDQMSEFIVMAATLLYIKSRMLLPKHTKEGEEPEEDPREELVRKLLEYKKVKYVSEELGMCQGELEQYCFRNKEANMDLPEEKIDYGDVLNDVSLKLLYDTFEQLMKNNEWNEKEKKEHRIDGQILRKDTFTIEQKTIYIRNIIILEGQTTFFNLCGGKMPKIERIVTFMAVLEMIHKREIVVSQDKINGDIVIKGGDVVEENDTYPK